MKSDFFSVKKCLNCNGSILNLEKPVVMGILNLSPDSFYDGGRYSQVDMATERIELMIAQGASIVDIGAYSSRPGAQNINDEEELKRLLPILDKLYKYNSQIVFSIDTFRAQIAKIAVKDFGVSIVNDISGGAMDEKMFDTIASLNVPYILMHMQGKPQNMQVNPEYREVVEDIIKFFDAKVYELKKLGVHDIILDPGFGFGKTIDHNYELLRRLESFKIFGLPILVGLSRKSMIYKFLNCSPEQALHGTTILNTVAIQKGANILRVHDVAEAKQAIDLISKLNL
ncbi:MAG: dihydropteroate synthase [Bacteroidales bacterium]